MRGDRVLYAILVFFVALSFGMTLLSAYYFYRMDAVPSPYGRGVVDTFERDWYHITHSGYFRSADTWMFMACFPALLATAIFQVLLFKLWRRGRQAPWTEAAWAVFRQFLPGFHIYGLFAGLIGLARNLNLAAASKGVKIKPVSTALATWTAVFLVACLAPFLGVVAVPAASIISVGASSSMTQTGTASPAMAALRGVAVALPGAICLLVFMNSASKAGRALAESSEDDNVSAE